MFLHWEVPAWHFDWIDAEQVVGGVAFPLWSEELIIAGVDQRRGDIRGRCQRVVTFRGCSRPQSRCEFSGAAGCESWVHRFDCGAGLPDHPAFLIFSGKWKALPKHGWSLVANGKRSESGAEVHQECDWPLGCNQRRFRRSNRVADHDDWVSRAVQCVQCGLGTLVVSRIGIIERQVWSKHPMSPACESLHQRSPRGAVVPVAVDQAICRHLGGYPTQRGGFQGAVRSGRWSHRSRTRTRARAIAPPTRLL